MFAFFLVLLLNITPVFAHTSPPCETYLTTSVRWKVATWNLDLLDFGFVTAPNYKVRSERLYPMLAAYLTSESAPDVLFLQEIWTDQDHATIRRAASDSGFIALATSSQLSRHGLQILVRADQVAESEVARFFSFSKRTTFERVSGVMRGALYSTVRLRDGRLVFLVNTHLTPFTDYTHVRSQQIETLGRWLRLAPKNTDRILLGGDLNIAGDFLAHSPSDHERFTHAHGLYTEFAIWTGLEDSHTSRQVEDPIYTYNPRFPALYHVRRSNAQQRLDYIWHGGAQVESVGVEFTEKIQGLFPSDHYLYYAVLHL